MKSFNENWDGIYRKAKQVEVNEENLNIGTYGFRIDRDSGKFVLYQLSYSQGSVRFPDGRKGTVIGRYATRDEAIAAAKRQAGVKEEVEQIDEVRRATKDADVGKRVFIPKSPAAERRYKEEDSKKPGEIWITKPDSFGQTRVGAKNLDGVVRYFRSGMEPTAKEWAKKREIGKKVPFFKDDPYREEVEVAEQFKAGDKVKVPHKGKMVSGKIVRYDDGGTDKARQHGGGYVVDVGEPASVLVPKQKVQKEEMTESSNLRTDLTNPKGKAVVNAKGKVIAVYRTERAARKHAETGKPVKEETELDEGLFNIRTEYNTFTKLDEFSKNMKVASIGMGKKEAQMYIRQVANSLMIASNQQKEFFRGLIGMLEYLHMDVGNPSSKTDNVKIMNRLQIIISELKKYQK